MEIRNLLIVRTDRIGDVLLTTPLCPAIRAASPKTKIYWLVRPDTAPLLENNPDVEGILVDSGQRLAELTAEIRRRRFDAAIVGLPRFRPAWALWRAKVPRRIGPASKWYSLWFTDRIWQRRSAGGKHEADFNLDLLAALGWAAGRRPRTRIFLREEEREEGRLLLEGHRIFLKKPLVFLHPGSAGSSARWPLRRFMALGDWLQEAGGCDVVVTAGPGETYQNAMVDQMKRIPVFIPAGSVSLRGLAALYSFGNLVVSNSTGPLHMAVALGVPTVSIYSPITTCHPRRWGPYPGYSEGDQDHHVLVGSVDASGSPDLATVSVEDVARACKERLKTFPAAAADGR